MQIHCLYDSSLLIWWDQKDGNKREYLSWIFHRKASMNQTDSLRSQHFDTEKKMLPLHQHGLKTSHRIIVFHPTVYRTNLNCWTELQLSKSDLDIMSCFCFFVRVESFVIPSFSSVQFTPVYGSSIQLSVYSTDVLRLCEYGCLSRPSLRGKPQVLHCLKVMSLICLLEKATLLVVVIGIISETKSQQVIPNNEDKRP